ncbi:hypothetical protein [Hymenobacter psoromatis]|uniref:hypothetical protein n=1 Tax=Hymenobacter psoromatis TaxID=1484116 RepID=UPI001CBEAD2D|nr:hypothetical protein [Hymenobacter psoromatis]
MTDSLFPVPHVQAQSTAESLGIEGPVSLALLHLLVPAFTGHRLAPPATGSPAAWLAKGDTLLVALSARPPNRGVIEWRPLDLDTIPAGQLRSLADVVRDGQQRSATYRQAGNPANRLPGPRLKLFPLVRRQGRYWVPGPVVLTE